ncbi:hypothetical protein A6R72_05580 [Xanthomonas translucens pv. graminis]|nr:hypothetical protein A6R72_05580 [Xanthomonas translucens pv. graminis]
MKLINGVCQFVAASDRFAMLIDEHPTTALLQLLLQIQRFAVLWSISVFKLLADFDKSLGSWQQFRIDPATQRAFWKGQIAF